MENCQGHPTNLLAKTSCNVSNDFEFSNISEEDVNLASIPVKPLQWTKYQQNF